MQNTNAKTVISGADTSKCRAARAIHGIVNYVVRIIMVSRANTSVLFLSLIVSMSTSGKGNVVFIDEVEQLLGIHRKTGEVWRIQNESTHIGEESMSHRPPLI